jgi:hypothetical protein
MATALDSHDLVNQAKEHMSVIQNKSMSSAQVFNNARLAPPQSPDSFETIDINMIENEMKTINETCPS